METPLLTPSLPIGALLDGRVDAIRRMDPKRGQAAAACELQVAFFTQLIKALRRTVPENSLLPRSPTRDVYNGLFDRELASVLAANDPLGLVSHLGGDAEKDAASVSTADGPGALPRTEGSGHVGGAPAAPGGPMASFGPRPGTARGGGTAEIAPAMAVPALGGRRFKELAGMTDNGLGTNQKSRAGAKGR